MPNDISTKNRKSFIAFSPAPGRYPFGGANLRFTDLSLVPKMMIEQTPVKPIGNTFPSGAQRGLESSDVTIENGNFGFHSINYLLEMFVGAATKSGAGASSFKRVYQPGGTPRDVALDYGERLKQLERYLYVFLTGLGIKGDLKTINVTGAGKGKEVDYRSDGVGAASTIDIALRQPNPPTDGLYLSDSYGGLGNPGASTPSPIDRFMAFEWACGGLLDVIATKKPGGTSWRVPLESDAATGDVKLTLGNDSNAWAYLPYVRENRPLFGRYEIVGKELETGTAEVQTVDLSGDDDPTGGVWPLTILGVLISGIPWNVSAAALQAFINSLDVRGARDITVSKTGFVYTFTYPSYLGNVAQVSSNNGATLTGAGGDTFAITINTTTPGVASLHELFALDWAGVFAAGFNPGAVAPLTTQEFPLWLIENSDITGWRITTITDLDDLDLAA